MNVKKLEWKKYDGAPITDVKNYIREWIKEWPNGEIMVGCDSQAHTTHIKYSVSINMHMIDSGGTGKGGHIIFANIIDTSKTVKNDLYTKLWAEVEYSVIAAQEIDAENLDVRIIIHLDYNSKPEKYSNVLYSGGLGYVRGMFPYGNVEVYGKPDAWAASHSSDAICKNKQAKGIR